MSGRVRSFSVGTATSATGNYFTGYQGASGSWVATTSGYTDPTNTGGNTLTTLFSNGIAVTAAGNSLPGIVFTPATSNSVYQIMAQFIFAGGAANGNNTCTLTDGNKIFAWGGFRQDSGGLINADVTMAGIYAGGTSSPVTIKIQLARDSASSPGINVGSVNLTPAAIQWQVLQLS